jgi:biotin carboxyl carrier protein
MSAKAHKIWVKVKGERFLVEVSDLNSRPIIATVEGTLFEIYPESSSEEDNPEPNNQDNLYQPKEQIHSIPGETVCEVIAPMPGDITQILVNPGQAVQPGDPLCVLDAMKMKNTIHAPQAGVIREINIRTGQAVDHGVVLFRFS